MSTFGRFSTTDQDRVAHATRDGDVMSGPIETSFCGHGRINKFRWIWKAADPPTSGKIEYKRICARCKEQSE